MFKKHRHAIKELSSEDGDPEIRKNIEDEIAGYIAISNFKVSKTAEKFKLKLQKSTEVRVGPPSPK